MELLARTEGIFAETAGGVTLAATRKLVERGPRSAPTSRSSSASREAVSRPSKPWNAGWRSRCASARASPRSRPCCRSFRRSSRAPGRNRGCQCSSAFPPPLRRHAGGTGEVYAKGKDVGELVDDLGAAVSQGSESRLCDETGDFRKFVNVYVNQEDVRFLQGRETLLKDGDEISIVPAIAGGRSLADRRGRTGRGPFP